MSISYKSVFEQALRESIEHPDYHKYFSSFRDHPELYHFIMAGEHQKYSPDREALKQALNINSTYYGHMVGQGPSRLGNGPSVIDGVESRHILMMTFLLSKIGTEWGNVVEIGGGYGNCLRLLDGLVTFDKWSVIDYKFISDLQEWFLRHSDVDITQVEFIGIEDRDRQAALNPTLVMGTHSLSEFSMEDFVEYFEIIKRSIWFYYVSHNSSPSQDLLRDKMELIRNYFTLDASMLYEGGNSTMYLFRT